MTQINFKNIQSEGRKHCVEPGVSKKKKNNQTMQSNFWRGNKKNRTPTVPRLKGGFKTQMKKSIIFCFFASKFRNNEPLVLE